MLAPNEKLGQYRLVEEIGRGGMGVVWKALDTRLGRHVALKLLSEENTSDPERLKRLEHEARTVASLNHPNIVTLFSVEEVDGQHFITMELVDGKSLAELIPPHGLTLEQFFDLAVPLADALGAAHERGVVHRDLKPANVMVDAAGRVKVLDFGLAKLRPDSESTDAAELPTASQKLLTQEGFAMGTVPYMSPEQLQGRELDKRTDLFSLGVVLYEMATGARPFQGHSSAELISAIMRDSPPSVTELRTGYPNHVGRIIRHCMEKSPDLRYQNAKDVRNELVGLRSELSSGQLARRATSAAARPVAPPRPRRALLRPAIAASLLLAGAAALWWALTPGDAADGHSSAVAVLPFTNLTGDPGRDYLSAGISAGLITQLSEISGIQVVGRAAAWSPDRDDATPAERARRLGVGAFLEGELQQEGERLRVDVKLTDAGSGLVLWSEGFHGAADGLIALQREITGKLATVLAIPLSTKERRRMARDPTGSFKAYELFIRGHQALREGEGRDAMDGASELFRQAIRLDDAFALAHAGLSEARWRSYLYDRVSEKLGEAEREARRALELDPELPAAQVALARVLRSTGRYAASIDELNKVLANHPKPDEAQRELAASYVRVGDLEQAESCLRAAAALGDRDWFNWNALGAFLHELGRYDEARQAFEQAATLAPEDVAVPHENLVALTVLQGRFDEAIAAYERMVVPIRDATLASNIGTAYYFSDRADRLERAEEYYRLAVQFAPGRAVMRRNLADLYLDQGRREDALHNYREALRIVEQQLRDDPENLTLRLDRALYSAKGDDCAGAASQTDALEPELPRTANNLHRLAHVHALCGRNEQALGAIEAAIALGFSREIIRQESEFAGLRDTPAFVALVAPPAERP